MLVGDALFVGGPGATQTPQAFALSMQNMQPIFAAALAFAEVLRILSNSVPFTGAGVGILIPLKHGLASLQFASKSGYFFFIWAMTLAAFLVVWWMGHSRFGASLMAVRDNEDAARALGVDAFRVKMGAIMLSGLFSGLGGVFYAQYFLYLDPYIAYGPAISVESLLVPIIGGLGTLFGPLLGAAALHAIAQGTNELIGDVPGISLALYGALLVAMVLFLPRGLACFNPWRLASRLAPQVRGRGGHA